MSKLQTFFAKVVKYDIVKLFSGFQVVFYMFSFYRKKMHFCSKIGCTLATYDFVSRYHSNQLSPNVTKMCLKDK